eukprot:scaffold31709_cov41-Cyclotella_meneghiniana.AAC.16
MAMAPLSLEIFYSIFVEGGTVVVGENILGSRSAYLAPGVLIVLFHRIFDVVRSAVRVVNSPG